jgi:hypothetical protein
MSSDITKLETMWNLSPNNHTWLSDTVYCLVKNIVKLSAQFNVMCAIDSIDSQMNGGSSTGSSTGCQMIETRISEMFDNTVYSRELQTINQVLVIYKEPLQRLADFFMDANNFFIQECAKNKTETERAKLMLLGSIVKNIRYVLRINSRSSKSVCDKEVVQAVAVQNSEAVDGMLSLFTQNFAGYTEFAKCVGQDIAKEFVSHFLYVMLEIGGSGSNMSSSSVLDLLISNKTLLYPITRMTKLLNVIDKTCMIKFIYALESFSPDMGLGLGSGSPSASDPTQYVCQMYNTATEYDLETMVVADQILKKYRSVLRNILMIMTNDAMDMVKSNTCNTLTNQRISLSVTFINSLRSVMQGRGVNNATVIETFDNMSNGQSSNKYFIIVVIAILIIIYFMGGFDGIFSRFSNKNISLSADSFTL